MKNGKSDYKRDVEDAGFEWWEKADDLRWKVITEGYLHNVGRFAVWLVKIENLISPLQNVFGSN